MLFGCFVYVCIVVGVTAVRLCWCVGVHDKLPSGKPKTLVAYFKVYETARL